MADLKQTFLERVQAYGCKNEDLAVNYFTRLNLEFSKVNPTIKWSDVNFETILHQSVVFANMGINPLVRNMVSFMPAWNKNGKWDYIFVEDYRAMELMARQFGSNCPENITSEVVYSNDKFSICKKDLSNHIEGYSFIIENPFDRGEIVGAFAYMEYEKPIYNKVLFSSIEEIKKIVRAFFKKDGSPTDAWENKNNRHQMCEKTILKKAWKRIPLNTSTELAEYYAKKPNEAEFEPENTEELPFDPDAEL